MKDEKVILSRAGNKRVCNVATERKSCVRHTSFVLLVLGSLHHRLALVKNPPERNAAETPKLQLSLQHLLYLPLLRSFLHLLPTDQVDGLGCKDQISLDGLDGF